MKTEQSNFWEGSFGRDYTDRNALSADEWNNWYKDTFGHTKDELNKQFLGKLSRQMRILEVGCNVGQQLSGLQRLGFTDLYGIELQDYAVEKARTLTSGINITKGSGLDIPFKDSFFDLVFTNGVLIHVHPENLGGFMDEMFRVSKTYIWGFEYFSKEPKQIGYRGHDGFLWKMDYAGEFVGRFPRLKVEAMEIFPYLVAQESGNSDCMYLLSK